MLKLNNFEILVSLLKENNLNISAAESCTGGLFSSGIVSVPEASKVFSSSFVTYSINSKVNTLGIPLSLINNYGVVSEQVALAMAEQSAILSGTEVGVGITGYAGPAYDENDTTAGTVCFGFTVNGKTLTSTKHFGNIGRNIVRELSVQYAASVLITLIEKFAIRNEMNS